MERKATNEKFEHLADPETVAEIRERLRQQIREESTLPDTTCSTTRPESTAAGKNASGFKPTGAECVVCQDGGFVPVSNGVVPCQCRKRKTMAVRLRAIPERFRQCTFANYIPSNGLQVRALDNMSSEITGSYFVHGAYGCGKTHLLIAQYAKLVQVERPCLLFTMAELMTEFRKATLDLDYFCEVRERADHTERFHLFIDDFDKFKVTEARNEALFDLINTLHIRQRGLTVTSNLSLRQLKASGQADPSVLRRIEDICEELEV
jgi:DNA replication protein DnaC